MSAACPVCKKPELTPARLQSDLPALGCTGCGGILLSLVSYIDWRERHPDVELATGKAIEVPAAEVVDSKHALLCPKCRRLMTKYRLSADARNVLDLCAHCDEVWFDRGEWTQVEHLARSGQLSRVFSDRWQQQIRKGEAAQRAEDRYREQLGEDYEAMQELRNRLRKHPRAREILAYLYTSQTTKA